MNFRTIDNLFLQAKKLITIIIFIFLILSVLFFLYWLLISMSITLPVFIDAFFVLVVNIAGEAIKNTPFYENLVFLLPLVVSMFFIAVTYLFSCLLVYVEDSHKKFKKYVQEYKANLEQSINKQLRRNFITELTKTNYFITKIRIQVKTLNSYLHEPMPEEDCRTLEQKIITGVCNLMNQSNLYTKELVGTDSAYFVHTDLRLASEFYAYLVQKVVSLINRYMIDKISINFYCAVDVFDNENELKYKLAELDKIVDLKVRNKILVSPRFKVYFQELYPGYFVFKLLGEYNFSQTSYRSQYVNIYTLHRNV